MLHSLREARDVQIHVLFFAEGSQLHQEGQESAVPFGDALVHEADAADGTRGLLRHVGFGRDPCGKGAVPREFHLKGIAAGGLYRQVWTGWFSVHASLFMSNGLMMALQGHMTKTISQS